MHTPLLCIHTCTHSTSSHSFSSLSSTGPANSTFSQPRSVDHQTAAATVVVATPEEDGSNSLDANQSGDSIGNSSFGEESTTTSNTAAPVTIGQQKATAILPEVHPVTGEQMLFLYYYNRATE